MCKKVSIQERNQRNAHAQRRRTCSAFAGNVRLHTACWHATGPFKKIFDRGCGGIGRVCMQQCGGTRLQGKTLLPKTHEPTLPRCHSSRDHDLSTSHTSHTSITKTSNNPPTPPGHLRDASTRAICPFTSLCGPSYTHDTLRPPCFPVVSLPPGEHDHRAPATAWNAFHTPQYPIRPLSYSS
jgi:hypothetical protein